MELEYDPAKRKQTLAKRGLDFEHCVELFRGPILFGSGIGIPEPARPLREFRFPQQVGE